MKELIKDFVAFLFLVVLFSTSALSAEKWVKYDANKTAESFVDMNSIHLEGGITRYRSLQNFKERFTPMLSIVTLHEMKCATREAKYISGTSYSEISGGGHVVGTMVAAMLGPDAANFQPIENDLVMHFSVVCK
jgi:hypothetical protein